MRVDKTKNTSQGCLQGAYAKFVYPQYDATVVHSVILFALFS